ALETEMNGEAQRAGEVESRVEGYQSLRLLFPIAQRYALLNQMLAVLRDGQGRPTPHTPEAVQGRLVVALRSLTVAVDVGTPPGFGTVSSAIAEAIHRVGVATAPRGDTADIVLSGQVSLMDVCTDTFGFVHARCVLEADARDRRRGASIGTLRLEAREGRNSEADAVSACARHLAGLVAQGNAGQEGLVGRIQAWLRPPVSPSPAE
ncbi:MAG: hypothetical protein QME96_12160, partial [Myxococcota bacterium]|nr:hypothetical protein [Myxococcota bacterium]